MWQLGLAASLGIAVPYLLISGFIVRGLLARHQLTTNPLGLATALIFFSCGIGHWLHGMHLLEGERFRDALDWHMVAWDASTAVIAVWYLSMRRRYHQLLTAPLMFDDPVRVEAEERAHHEATHDPLTGLANRNALRSAAQDALRSRHGEAATCAIFLDLDGFKAVNDTCGHEAGDELLVQVGRRLRTALRPDDLLARLGGDEFVVLLRDSSSLDAAVVVADRLIDSLRPPFDVGSHRVEVTASAGIARESAGSSAEVLMRRADRAMYDAKQAGGDRHAVADPYCSTDPDPGPRRVSSSDHD